MPTSILLVDDHPVFRKGIYLLLEQEPDMRVIGEAGDGQAAIDRVRDLSPDVVVMDITMPNLNGIDATRHIVSESPHAKVIALSIHSGKRFVEDMLGAGAVGYILKESVPEELINGIRAVMRGEVYLSPAITGIVVSQYVDALTRIQAPGKTAELTAREKEALQLIADGASTKQIASVLQVAPKTVESTRRRIMQKLDVNTVAELTEIASHEGLIEQTIRPAGTDETSARSITTTKLRRPRTPGDHVHRSRLLKQLDKGHGLPLTLVSAPAGYGKSTLVSSWVEACDCPSAWITLDKDDNDLHLFLNYLIHALQTVFPELDLETQDLLSAPSLPPVSVLARYLLNDLDDLDETFILVLDDYHLIHETAVHDLLAELLSHPPPAMHLALLTRRDPPLPISTLRARAQLTEIGVSQLRFTPEETAEFLERVIKEPVDKTAAAILEQKTEGWITGLRLASLTLRDRSDLERIARALKEGLHYITDYLVREVLSQQPPVIANYLMETSVPDRFCASLCEELHGSSGEKKEEIGGQEFIEWLEKTNLFVISLDETHQWFRYHHLFQQLLQSQLKRKRSTEEIAALHARAGAWFGENGLLEEALKHALAAGDIDGAVDLVRLERQSVLNADKWYTLERWLPMFPKAVIEKRPELLVTRIWLLYHHFQFQSILPTLETVESLFKGEPEDQVLYGEVDFFRGYCCYFLNEGQSSLKHLQAALERIPLAYHEIRGQAELVFGLACQMEGRKEKAVHMLNDLIYGVPPSHNLRKTRLLASLVYIHIISADPAKAFKANKELMDVATAGHYSYAKAWSVYLQGLISFYRGEFEKTVHDLSQALEDRYILHTRAAFDCMAGLAFAHQFLGQPDRADAVMEHLFVFAGELNDPAYSAIAASCRARLFLIQGQTEEAVNMLPSDTTSGVENIFIWLEIQAVTHCKVLIAKGSDAGLERAEKRLQEYLKTNQDNHNTRGMIEILSLLSLLHKKQGKNDEALSLLKCALDLAKPGEWVHPFIEPGPPMADLLNMLEKKDATAFSEKILDKINKLQTHVSPTVVPQVPSARPLQPLIEPLTNRELDILGLLEQRLQSKEIAEKLFISTETVKSHLKNIFQKLDAANRRQAVEKAKNLGII